MRFILAAAGFLACIAPAHAQCAKPGDTVSDVGGQLDYGMPWLEPGQTFPTSVQRGRRGNYYVRPVEPMCIDKGDGASAVKVDYLWIDVLSLDDATLANMQGWIRSPVKVAGVVALDAARTGATAKIAATSVVQEVQE